MELTDLLQRLRSATSPADIFGEVEPMEEYLRLIKIAHPDKTIYEEERQRATEATKLLNGWKEKLLAPPIKITSKKRTYEVTRPFAAGDICDLYKTDDNTVLKVARAGSVTALLKNEASILKKLQKKAAGTLLRHYFPEPIESFELAGAGQRMVNVFAPAYHNRLFTFKQVKQQYPSGVPSRDVVWMFRRLLNVLEFCHANDVVHAAVLPEHILIEPTDRGLLLVDWVDAGSGGRNLDAICLAYKSFYPPEVIARQKIDKSTDLFMAAKCIEYLLGGLAAAPQEIRGVLSSLLLIQRLREADAAEVIKDLKEASRRAHGAPSYREFQMS